MSHSTPPITSGFDGNPFATRWVRPGAVEYIFPDGIDTHHLIAQLRSQAWWGQIVGPHGSGKSTLLCNLLPHIEHAGGCIHRFRLFEGQRRLNVTSAETRSWYGQTQIVVDGYEQLSRWSQFKLKQTCRRRGSGLLVTAHRSVGLPDILSTSTSLDTALQLVSRLLASHPGAPAVISNGDVARCYERLQGNLREVLFALYDLYEQRR